MIADIVSLALQGGGALSLVSAAGWLAVNAYERGSRARNRGNPNDHGSRDRQVTFEAQAMVRLEKLCTGIEQVVSNTASLPTLLERLNERIEQHNLSVQGALLKVDEIHRRVTA